MSPSAPSLPFDALEQAARIGRLLSENEKLLDESRKLSAEFCKLTSEALNFEADRRKIERDHDMVPWQVAFAGLGAGAAIVGATIALVKVLGH